ncbi:MAG: dehydrogenase [Treponema sp.]|jgi:D-glycero-alpha-D-manno-heptose-7-phosphate kinase|nr:dehydrogenase [Treponema sp.]
MIIRSKAPLRLGLAGGGSDIKTYYDRYGGHVLNAAIGMYAYCILESADDGRVLFRAADLEIEETYGAEGVLPTNNPLMLHTGIYNRIVRDYNGGAPLSLRMITYSDAPAGSGLGSSSTLVVAIIKAYTEYLSLPLGEYDIASLACTIERVDLGQAGGKQDQYAATFGGFNFMEFYKGEQVIVNPLRLKRWIRNELEASLVLFHTGVSRDSANIISQQIADTANEKPAVVESTHEVKRQAALMKEALLRGDFREFSRCLLDGWRAKRNMAASITNDFLDGLYRYVLDNGAESAKISGAGGGGFMMIYTDPSKRTGLIRALKKKDGIVLTPGFTEIGTQAWRL